MRAAWYRGAGKPLSIEVTQDPTPALGEVIVKVERCGICTSDLHMTESHDVGSYSPDIVLGHEYAGEVVEVRAGTSRLRVGAQVTVHPVRGCGSCIACLAREPFWCPTRQPLLGGYGEYTAVTEQSCILLPSGLSHADGALMEPLAAAAHAVALAGIRPGARLIVLGAGPVGLAAIYWSRRLGASRILTLARSRRNEALAMTMGASAFLADAQATAGELGRLLGGPAEIVVECVGLPGVIARAIELVRPRGTIVVAGMCMLPDTTVPAVAMSKELRVQYSVGYGEGDFRLAVDAMGGGAVEPRTMITQTIGLQSLPAVFEALRGPHGNCKVQVAPWILSDQQPSDVSLA